MEKSKIKEYFLGDGIDFIIGISHPHYSHEQTQYYDNEPVVTMHSMSDYILLGAVNDDIKTRVLLTPKQAKTIAKQLKKLAKRLKKQKSIKV